MVGWGLGLGLGLLLYTPALLSTVLASSIAAEPAGTELN
jgi:hypothetical protein